MIEKAALSSSNEERRSLNDANREQWWEIGEWTVFTGQPGVRLRNLCHQAIGTQPLVFGESQDLGS